MKKIIAFLVILICAFSMFAFNGVDEDALRDELREEILNELRDEKDDKSEPEDENAEADAPIVKYYSENVYIEFRVPRTTYDEYGNKIAVRDEYGNIEYEALFMYNIPKLEKAVEFTDDDGNTYMAPTVLTAVEVALKKYEKDFYLSADKTHLAAAFGHTEKEHLDEKWGYFDYWKCTINDVVYSEDRQSISRVYTNDKIVFTWTREINDRADVTEAVTEDPDDIFVGDIDYGETEEPVETMDSYVTTGCDESTASYDTEYPFDNETTY